MFELTTNVAVAEHLGLSPEGVSRLRSGDRSPSWETMVKAQKEAETPIDMGTQGNPELEMAQAEHEANLEERKFERDTQLKFMEFGLRREAMAMDQQLKAADMQAKREQQRVDSARQAAAAAQKPQNQGVPQ